MSLGGLELRPGYGKRDEATALRKCNRVAVRPDAHQLDEGELVEQDKIVEGPEEIAVFVQAEAAHSASGPY